jgi:hypothetical protein
VGGDEERWRKLAELPPPFIAEIVETLRRVIADEEQAPF